MKSLFTYRDVLAIILLILFQALILNEVRIQQYIQPQLFILGLLTLSSGIPKSIQLVIGFVTGFCLDLLLHTYGIHAFSLVALMYLKMQYFNFVFAFPENVDEIKPNVRNMGVAGFTIYLVLFTFIYHLLISYLNHLSFSAITDILQTALYSTPLAVLLMLLTVFSFYRTRDIS